MHHSCSCHCYTHTHTPHAGYTSNIFVDPPAPYAKSGTTGYTQMEYLDTQLSSGMATEWTQAIGVGFKVSEERGTGHDYDWNSVTVSLGGNPVATFTRNYVGPVAGYDVTCQYWTALTFFLLLLLLLLLWALKFLMLLLLLLFH